jgi:hypothetical protein
MRKLNLEKLPDLFTKHRTLPERLGGQEATAFIDGFCDLITMPLEKVLKIPHPRVEEPFPYYVEGPKGFITRYNGEPILSFYSGIGLLFGIVTYASALLGGTYILQANIKNRLVEAGFYQNEIRENGIHSSVQTREVSPKGGMAEVSINGQKFLILSQEAAQKAGLLKDTAPANETPGQ